MRAEVFRLRRVVWALLAVALLFTCDQRAFAADRAHLALWHAYVGDEQTALDLAVARFREARPDLDVEVLALPFDAYTNKLTAAVPRGNGPDLFIDTHDRLGIYLRDGVVAQATVAIPQSDEATYSKTTLDAVTLEGIRYGVPLGSKSLALYTNKTLVPSPPKTLEALFASPKPAGPGSFPLAYESTNPYFHAPFLHAFGGKLLGDHGDFAMVGAAAARSVDVVRDWTARGYLPVEPNDVTIVDLFTSGRAAAVISGPWFQARLEGKVDYRVTPLPALDAAGGALVEPFLTVEAVMFTPLGLSHGKDAAALARFLATGEGAKLRAIRGHQIVADRSAWEDPEVAKDERLKAFADAAEHAIPMPTSRAMRATWVPAQSALLKVIRGDASADVALAEAKHRFDDVMRPPPPAASKTPLFVLVSALLLIVALLAVRRARAPDFRPLLRRSLPAYAYVTHAVIVVVLLVVLPLVAGALTSLFAGGPDDLRYVGLANYVQILTARGGPLLAHGSFWLTLLVTLLWTVANVTLHLAIGLTLGIALSRPVMRLKAVYRVLLILPWAVPSYVTALAWKGMFHTQFGAINAVLKLLGAEPVAWFSRFGTAFAANLATNVWLGFPFMMVVTMGALTSIPKEVLEAAEVDGATRWQRFVRVTLPLLRPALLPSVILGAIWTFNMFNVVFLVSGGEPDETTDILVSEAYRWAFERDAQYGYAAAYAVLIFLLLVFGTRLLGRVSPDEGAAA